MVKYNAVVEYIETNHRNPSRYRLEEHNMLNWLKANRKKLNAGEMNGERMEMFKRLLGLVADNMRENQYQ